MEELAEDGRVADPVADVNKFLAPAPGRRLRVTGAGPPHRPGSRRQRTTTRIHRPDIRGRLHRLPGRQRRKGLEMKPEPSTGYYPQRYRHECSRGSTSAAPSGRYFTTGHIPVILLTGSPLLRDPAARRGGADDYIANPSTRIFSGAGGQPPEEPQQSPEILL